MEYSTTHLIYFSPTHTSQKIIRAIGCGIGMGRRIETDLTYKLEDSPILIKDELTVIAVPVYAGRVAPIALERIGRLKGENAPVILVVTYGNRDYEDALVELRDTLTKQGFTPLSAAAFVGEHSYSRPGMPIAEGRPDTKDLSIAESFGSDSLKKLQEASSLQTVYPFAIKGNVPYREVGQSAPTAPITKEELCGVCGECLDVCPTKAIFINESGKIDTEAIRCIKCCACVKECPTGARVFDTPYTAMLHANFSARREPELFF
ncbi:MAG: 4Fe-4S dicluster domain-containing protein [Bacteroides sp.]